MVEYRQLEEHPDPWDLPGANLAGADNDVVLDTEGSGHYVGCLLSIDNFNAGNQTYTWPGEGDDMFFVDGDTWPSSLHGTGTGTGTWDFWLADDGQLPHVFFTSPKTIRDQRHFSAATGHAVSTDLIHWDASRTP